MANKRQFKARDLIPVVVPPLLVLLRHLLPSWLKPYYPFLLILVLIGIFATALIRNKVQKGVYFVGGDKRSSTLSKLNGKRSIFSRYLLIFMFVFVLLHAIFRQAGPAIIPFEFLIGVAASLLFGGMINRRIAAAAADGKRTRTVDRRIGRSN